MGGLLKSLLASAKAKGCQSTPCARHPRDLKRDEILALDIWGGFREVVFVYEAGTGLLYRVPLEPGQSEDLHVDVRDELATMDPRKAKAVILFDPPRIGPLKGQVHFGLVAWEEPRGRSDEEAILVYPPLVYPVVPIA